MGKRIIQQARGHGSGTYRVKRRAFRFKTGYPLNLQGEGQVVKLLNSTGHSAPLAKVSYQKNGKRECFYIPAFKEMYEGQKIILDDKEAKIGSVLRLADIPIKKQVYCVESKPGDGGVFMKSAGSSGVISKVVGKKTYIQMPSKKEKAFNQDCRAIVGVAAGSGRLDKPIVKAGRGHYIHKSKGKLWPRTSAVKVNVIDHPFGSGRGKNPKSKIPKRNAPPGRKVGLLRARRTGKRK
ncbi:50S ribosomal protein L2 [Patescibacteria group bacterium]|nr:50S ribosomal protein L2 [Patescibacteria group bacterium]